MFATCAPLRRKRSGNGRDNERPGMAELPGTPCVVIVGYGNSLRGDDGFGPAVAERLADRVGDARVRVLVRHLLTAELAVDLASAQLCLLIDATSQGEPGLLSCREVAPESIEIGALGHDLSPEGLLGLTLAYAGQRPQCWLYSTVAECMELGECLTPRVAAVVEEAVRTVHEQVARFFAKASREA
jgi:hydrogenase maturation protease